jgi:hypothetical protein
MQMKNGIGRHIQMKYADKQMVKQMNKDGQIER